MKTKHYHSTVTVNRARELYSGGMSLKAIVRTLNAELPQPVSYHTVHHWIYDVRRRDAVPVIRMAAPKPQPPLRVIWPDEVVRRARVLRERARLGEKVIARVLATEMDPSPSVNSVRDWIRGRTRLAA